ncbi:RNA-binding domain-containing protein [Algibacter mikhailovii]|uniref:RNA-binding domain-containing protein n=1 Tax=Algibacter mikhailovii TaxID=425498 RepID=UPI0024943CF9|nr:transporter substrate-binding domain-containing protein [Algibacter mikhailovii]
MLSKTILKVLCFILIIGYAQRINAQEYKIACLNDYPPYSSINEQGEATGFLIDWWNLWSAKAGIDITFIPGNTEDCIGRLNTNKVDIIAGAFFSEELNKDYDFGDQILSTQAILCIKKDLDPVSIDSIGFLVSIVKNGYTGNYLEENHPSLELDLLNSNRELYSAVEQQSIDAFVYITPEAVLDLVKVTIPDGYKQFEVLYSNNLRPMVKKGNKKILADIMKGSEAMSKEDLLEVATKWNVFKDKVTVDRTLLYVIIGIIALLVLGVLLFIKRILNKKNSLARRVFNLEEEISKGESDFLEFKSSLRWDYHKNVKNKVLELVVAKTISAFLNSNGGILLIGVNDDGAILGLDNDYNTLSKGNQDGFVLALTTLINNTLGKQSHKYINIRIVNIGDKDVCVITIERSGIPVFLVKGEKEEFFIRASASSQPLGLKDTMAYIKSHWESEK